MMTEMTRPVECCKTCRFYADPPRSICRYDPPTVYPSRDRAGYDTAWPVTYRDDWCGRWEMARGGDAATGNEG